MVRSPRRSAFLVVFVVLLCGALGALFGQRLGSGAPSSDTDIRDSVRSFSQVYDLVEQNYAEPVNADKAIYNGAIQGMLRVLDPHSNFFDPKQYSLLREEQRGKYYGVGMTVGPRNNKVIVIAPMVGTPAYRAGIHPGDIIVAVDGKPTDNMDTTAVADLLKGPKGTQVKITILREGSPKPLDFVVTRDEIPRYSVDLHFLIRPGVGYIHVNGFQETTEQEVQDALDQFGDLKGLVLDLRGNPGGLLSEGVGVADKFLHKGQVIVSHHGRSSPEKVYRASHGNGGRDYPLVVLVNRGTASAAEIVSGAIQDHDRGLIVGETTFGKGLVQTVYPLSENTGLALTTAKYYTPSGRLIQRDYSHQSFWEYYQHRNDTQTDTQDVKATDSGRKVFGGGGITPDEKYTPGKLTIFQRRTGRQGAPDWFYRFANVYFGPNKPVLPVGWQADDATVERFRKYIREQNVPFTDAEFDAVKPWVKRSIRWEFYYRAFDKSTADRADWAEDPEVEKAIESMPKAASLLNQAEKVYAMRR